MNSSGYIVPLLLSMVAGGFVGYINGSRTGGVRTFAIICCGSTLVTLISKYFFVTLGISWLADPGRLSAQIIMALVFLTSGILWLTDERYESMSVATNILLAAMIGMVLGADPGVRSTIIIGFVILVFWALERVERIILKRRLTWEKPKKVEGK